MTTESNSASTFPAAMFKQPAGTETKFNVWCEGDSSVGLAGARATVFMDALPSDIEDIKECLKEAFENIWSDDVKIMTEDDIARDVAANSL